MYYLGQNFGYKVKISVIQVKFSQFLEEKKTALIIIELH